ncbi:MAG: hypothetical protein MJZ81_05980 [Bacteroidales bacterium]|nr:hypothetical protein [Bacteroidales bacterium]
MYNINNIEVSNIFFPVPTNGDLTNFIELEEYKADTVLVLLRSTYIMKKQDTLNNGMIIQSGLRRPLYRYETKHFSHFLTIQNKIEDVKYARLLFEGTSYFFERKRGNRYKLKSIM